LVPKISTLIRHKKHLVIDPKTPLFRAQNIRMKYSLLLALEMQFQLVDTRVEREFDTGTNSCGLLNWISGVFDWLKTKVIIALVSICYVFFAFEKADFIPVFTAPIAPIIWALKTPFIEYFHDV